MRKLLTSALRSVDGAIARAALTLGRESPALLVFVFHGVFESEAEVESGIVSPIEPLLLPDLERMIEHFLEHRYRFVSPPEIVQGLDPNGRYVLLTFDDGYANNLRALPLLQRFSVPATFFVSTNHVLHGKSFWWDVLYRERLRCGASRAAIQRETEAMKCLAYHKIEAQLRSELGEAALRPIGDTDRPMRADEIRGIARDPLVCFGNHTADHAILTILDDGETASQIRDCQIELARLCGTSPVVIAYPNGAYDERIVQIARREGLSLGFVVAQRKTKLPLSPERKMTIPRYVVRTGARLIEECKSCRSDFQVLHRVREIQSRYRRTRSSHHQSQTGY